MSASHTPLVAARRRSGVGLSYLIMSGVLLGTGGFTGRLLNKATGLSPVAVASYRLAVGGALIVVFLALTGRRMPRGRAAWARIAVVGVLAAVYQACFFASVSLTSVSLATLIAIGAFPVLVSAMEGATGQRRVDRRMLGTICLALAGLGLLVGLPSGGFGATATLASAGLAIAAAGGFATVTVIGARPVPGLDELSTTGLAFFLGGLLLAPVAGVTAGLGFKPSAPAIGLLIALGTAPTAVAYTLYFRALRTIDPSTAAVMTLLEPLTGAILAAVVLGDRLGAPGIVGAVVLAAAVIRAAKAPGAQMSDA
jgi:DME family drug/metabolite transporter